MNEWFEVNGYSCSLHKWFHTQRACPECPESRPAERPQLFIIRSSDGKLGSNGEAVERKDAGNTESDSLRPVANPSTPVVPVEPARPNEEFLTLKDFPRKFRAIARSLSQARDCDHSLEVHAMADMLEASIESATLTPVPVVAAPQSAEEQILDAIFEDHTICENCPTSRRTGQGDCGEMFTVHGVTHSCKYLADHEGSHWCNCKVATTPSPVSTDVPVAQPPRVEYEAMRQIFNALADTEASGAAEQLAHVEEIVTKYFRCATHTPVSREPLPCHICGTALDPNWLNCPKCEGKARSSANTALPASQEPRQATCIHCGQPLNPNAPLPYCTVVRGHCSPLSEREEK